MAADLSQTRGRPHGVHARAPYKDGSHQLTPTPATHCSPRARFGDKSVIEWPEYQPPRWLDGDFDAPGLIAGDSIGCHPFGRRYRCCCGRVMARPTDSPYRSWWRTMAPSTGVLEAVRLLDQATARRGSPPMRAALIGPVERNEIYSASAIYGRDACPSESSLAEQVCTDPPGSSLSCRHGREPRRPGDAPRSSNVSRQLRRALPAIGQLLPPALRQAGAGLPPLPADLAVRGTGARRPRTGPIRSRSR